MRMCIQMLLTVFVIPVTFGTESKLQLRAVYFCSAANRAFMLGDTGIALHVPLEFLSSVDLLRIQMHHIA